VDESTAKPRPGPPPIPGYELLEKIGEGGMGEVYRARQLSLQRTVAVKFLNNSFPLDQTPVLAFQRESSLMASLTHRNIVAIHDCGIVEGTCYLVLEYVPGSPLRALMKPGKPWRIGRARPILDAIAQALAYIHRRGILHLDLKPENVLCSRDGTIKITDFGVARPRMDARALSERGLSPEKGSDPFLPGVRPRFRPQGTIDYCAPEQRYGLRVDPRTDLFALATLAYELLTGQVPGRAYVPASHTNRRLPPAVDEVLRRGLARDAEERYASVEEFRTQLLLALQRARPSWLPWALGVGGGLLLALLLLLGQRCWDMLFAGGH
jgi:serine/threonine protein kinase